MSGDVFLPSDDGTLCQGEILSGLTTYEYKPAAEAIEPVVRDYCILITQDCDLVQDFALRSGGGLGSLDHVLLVEGQLAEALRPTIKGSDLWKVIRQNKNERFQLISPVQANQDKLGQGFQSLVFDFRKIFSVPVEELYRQVGSQEVARRSKLTAVYRESFQQRVAWFLSRIPLPIPHSLE